jgi:hypothetical protein
MVMFESPAISPLIFACGVWMKSGAHKLKVDTRNELLASIVDAAAHTEKY